MQSHTPQQQLIGAKPRHRFIKSLSFGVLDVFFSTSRTPWIFFDLIFVFITFGFGITISPYGERIQWDEPFFETAAIYSVTFVLFAIGLGYYDRVRRYRYRDIFRVGTLSSTFAIVVTLTILYFVYYGVFGRLTLLWGTAFAFGCNFLLRMAVAFILRHNPYSFTIIGSSPYMDEVVNFCSKSDINGRVYHYVPWSSVFTEGVPVDFHQLINHRVGDVVLTREALEDASMVEFAVSCLQGKLRVVDEIDFYIQIFERLPLHMISKEWVLREGLARRQVISVAVKRWLDIVFSTVAIIALAPILLIIASAIRLTSPGPAIFKQERQGRYSKPFRMYKFRTMTIDAPAVEAGFTKVGDQRVTPIGRVLRKFHLDELPQLLNIWRGQMSVVGPRPEALSFAAKMRAKIPLYDLRYLVRPGLTGHAQLNQGYAMDSVADTEIKLANDLYYLCYHSFWQDIALILRTVFYVVGQGSR